MSRIIIPGEPRETTIPLATRTGRPIPNNQSRELSQIEFDKYDRFPTSYKGVIVRTKPNPIYNCHGLTFASKRTRVYKEDSLRQILEDDNYEEIPKENVLPGDIILYYGNDGSIQHSGIVVEKPKPPLGCPKIVSKWGVCGEIVHFAYVKPQVYGTIYKYYRAR